MQISVIIPTYKPKKYFFECLDSLAKQTLDASLWEVILVLNGCNEPWQGQIREYISMHSLDHFRLIQIDEAGVSNARNIGLETAQGEYIAFIDDDDYVSSTYLEELLVHASEDTIALSNTEAFSEKGYQPYYIEQEYLQYSKEGKQPFYRPKRYFGGPCMKLIHRSIIGDRRFDTRFANGEDSLFMFSISDHSKFVDFTNKNAVYYRRFRTDSATSKEYGWRAFFNRLSLIKAYSLTYWSAPLNYNFGFYVTRIIASIHTIFTNL